MKVKLRDIVPSARPVRLAKDTVKMEELTRSVKEQGMIAPIKVRPAGGRYEVVYGHRRVEAARRAGLEEIEALIEEMDDTRALVEALVENIQREDMKPLDTARALRMLMDETGWSQREVERRGIVSQARVSQLLALLEEPEEIQAVLDNPVSPSGISVQLVRGWTTTLACRFWAKPRKRR
jgi:ParB family chromosome partitioning protein